MENGDVAGFDEGPLHSNVYMLQMRSDSESDSDEDSSHPGERYPPNRANVRMLANLNIGKVEETADDFGGFEADLHGFVGNNHNNGEWKDAYDRKLPGNYEDHEEHQVDTFTRNVLKNYATEGVTEDGKPNGQFFIVKDQCKELSKEVVGTHLGLSGAKRDEWLGQHFDDMWTHYDVNNEGVMDALWVSTFMRALCKPVKDIDLQ